MLFTVIMSKRTIYSFIALIVLLWGTWLFSDSNKEDAEFSELAKIALRDVGNQLLLSNQDSTSLVLPVVALERFKYELSFEEQLSFEPSNLVSVASKSLKKAKLPRHYRVEVVECSDQEVSYSYAMSATKESTIIPCAGRTLPNNCYTIVVKFTKRTDFASTETFLYVLIILAFLILQFVFYKKKQTKIVEESNEKYAAIGSFQFYPEQNKLIKQAVEISLSKKECELLAIFVANPNQIIKRDELTKKVWEDNGVFVSRSLDTYISKLRKKLKDDDSIKLTNVHGIGYKLEIKD